MWPEKGCFGSDNLAGDTSAQYQAEYGVWPVLGPMGVMQLVTEGLLKSNPQDPHDGEGPYMMSGGSLPPGTAMSSNNHNPGY